MVKRIVSLIPTIPGSLRLWLTLAVALVLLAGFVEVVDDVFQDPEDGDLEAFELDRRIMSTVATFRTPLRTQVMTDLTALGSVSVVLVMTMIVFTLLIGLKDKVALLHLTISAIGAGVIPAVLKSLFGRVRPDVVPHLVNVSDLSFPSGHAFGSAAIYSTLAFFAARHLRDFKFELFFYLLAAVVIFLVGLSRIYLGVHFPTDVFAGICGGVSWSAFLTAALLPVYGRAQREVQAA